jgi:hypothetical protein
MRKSVATLYAVAGLLFMSQVSCTRNTTPAKTTTEQAAVVKTADTQSPCTTKPPCGPMVRLDKFAMDGDGRLTITVSSDTMVYTLLCSKKQGNCFVPSETFTYELIDNGEKLKVMIDFLGEYTKGKTVALYPPDGKEVGIYALWEAHRKSSETR